jgi:hypothetical protein
LESLAELRAAVTDSFALPRCPVAEAVGALERITGRPLFGDEGKAE